MARIDFKARLGIENNIFLPGYLGHRPQYKFTCGETYGKITTRLAKSNATVSLSQNYDRPVEAAFQGKIIAGYEGHIPGWTSKFGASFNRTSSEALSDFHAIDTKHKFYHENLFKTVKNQKGLGEKFAKENVDVAYSRYHPPPPSRRFDGLRKFAANAPPIAGYMGWTPRLPFYGEGRAHSHRMNEALTAFDGEQSQARVDAKTDVRFKPRKRRENTSRYSIYTKLGMIPNYSGHVPDERDAVGQTYGVSTKNLPICQRS
ncbi:ciliary microtubule inner protein 2B-like [Oscarella lobularis]|uniref:ciliary microtubule inner protein 2B-like n=1 Tax=Oscarella lobularis TaxID=121494 RepID=UPI00331327BD